MHRPHRKRRMYFAGQSIELTNIRWVMLCIDSSRPSWRVPLLPLVTTCSWKLWADSGSFFCLSKSERSCRAGKLPVSRWISKVTERVCWMEMLRGMARFDERKRNL